MKKKLQKNKKILKKGGDRSRVGGRQSIVNSGGNIVDKLSEDTAP